MHRARQARHPLGLAGGDDTLIVDHLPSMTTLRNRLDDSSAALVRDMLGLADRGESFELFDALMRGDIKLVERTTPQLDRKSVV
mgnify:CR=1 FL=1